MKLIYVANIRLPTEKAHGIQIIKTCEALAESGVEVELVVPKRQTDISEDPFVYYRAVVNFKITRLWCLDTVKFGWLGYWTELITFAERATWYVLFKRGTFFTRDEFLAFYLRLLGKKVVWEAHMGQTNIFVRLLIVLRVQTISISNGLRDLYIKFGVSPERITVIPDGVDIAQFDIAISKEEARARLGIESNKKLVIYTGSLYAWKGTDTLEEAGRLLPENIEVKIVSGRPYAEIPLYLKSSDVLVLPNSALEIASKIYTSPMKLFEYMASGRPIVASDIPSLREIIDESTGYFFKPDDAESLANKISEVINDEGESLRRAKNALNLVQKFSWHKRAERIIKFIKC